MARVSTYLNFSRHTEEAFQFYAEIFGTQIDTPSLMRFSDRALPPDVPPVMEADRDLIIHIELPILGGHVLMGTDAPESMGFKLTFGDNIHINLEPDSLAETRQLFNGLSTGGKIDMELQPMFWGGSFGSCQDRYGVHWMFNCGEVETRTTKGK